MKAILAVLLMVAAVESIPRSFMSNHEDFAYESFPPINHFTPRLGIRRHSHPFKSWHNPPGHQKYHQNYYVDANVDTAEWVCQSPRTGDIMIIASDDGTTYNQGNRNRWNVPAAQPQYPPASNPHYLPIPQPHYPPGYGDQQNHNNENVNVNDPPSSDHSSVSDDKTETPPQHGGEGLIDIRIGE